MVRAAIDLTGRTIGAWFIEKLAPKPRGAKRRYYAVCTGCGTRRLVRSDHLLASGTLSCGCQTVRDLTGLRVGRLRVLSRAKAKEYPHAGAAWECLCDCGKTIVVPSSKLTRPVRPKRSCGCTQQRNVLRERREPVVRCEAYRAGVYNHRRVAVGEVVDVKVGSFCSSWLRRVPPATPLDLQSDESTQAAGNLAEPLAAPTPISSGRSSSQGVLDKMREERLGGRVVRVWRSVTDDDQFGRARTMDDDVPLEDR